MCAVTETSLTVRYAPADSNAGRVGTYLAAPTTQARALSPKSEGSPSQIQAPTRSLWIGNLDSTVSSEQLIHVFAPYGAIESLRLLPEKVRIATHNHMTVTLPSLLTRNVDLSISSTRLTRSAQKTMSSTASEARSAWRMGRP